MDMGLARRWWVAGVMTPRQRTLRVITGFRDLRIGMVLHNARTGESMRVVKLNRRRALVARGLLSSAEPVIDGDDLVLLGDDI